jgi:hypothetical protein
VHAHLVPPGLLDAARKGSLPGVVAEAGDGGRPVLAAGADRLGPVGPEMTDLDGRLRWMDERSIAEQWVSPWLDLFTWHRFGGEDGGRWAAAVNEALAEAARGSGGRLRPVPFADVSAGAAAAAREVTALAERHGPPAVMLSTHPAGVSSVADASLGRCGTGSRNSACPCCCTRRGTARRRRSPRRSCRTSPGASPTPAPPSSR